MCGSGAEARRDLVSHQQGLEKLASADRGPPAPGSGFSPYSLVKRKAKRNRSTITAVTPSPQFRINVCCIVTRSTHCIPAVGDSLSLDDRRILGKTSNSTPAALVAIILLEGAVALIWRLKPWGVTARVEGRFNHFG